LNANNYSRFAFLKIYEKSSLHTITNDVRSYASNESLNTIFNKINFMSVVSYLSRSDVFLISSATAIIILAFVITTAVQGEPEKSFSQILNVGPVWRTDSWICSSTEEFMIYGLLIGYKDPSALKIFVSGSGSQPDIRFEPRELQSFSIGGVAGSSIQITSGGGVSGFLTLQTMSDATATCEPV